MTDAYQPIAATQIQALQPLLAGFTKGLIDLATRIASGLAEVGLPTSFDLQGDWVKLTLLTDQGASPLPSWSLRCAGYRTRLYRCV